ncbi:hypothetical protein AB0M47_20890 [Hamadaea sp. NPDC051192]|uniref:hypothetical protein n=1 Tax=Hamadaea sp. NPDC051192 TaxID=3154940 RepID=UPI003433A383
MFTDADTARELQRCKAYEVPQIEPLTYREESFHTATREFAQAVCQVFDGKTWEAHAVMPRYWREDDHQTDQVVIVDDGFLIVFSHIVQARRDRLRLTLNGTPVAHRPLRGVMAWHHDAAVRSLWLHVQLIEPDPCGALTCRKAPEWTALNGAAYCDEHAGMYL